VDVDGDKFPKGLLDEATTLLFAGHDTQSATLSWGLLRLIDHEYSE
jgi:cytochrome P450